MDDDGSELLTEITEMCGSISSRDDDDGEILETDLDELEGLLKRFRSWRKENPEAVEDLDGYIVSDDGEDRDEEDDDA